MHISFSKSRAPARISKAVLLVTFYNICACPDYFPDLPNLSACSFLPTYYELVLARDVPDFLIPAGRSFHWAWQRNFLSSIRVLLSNILNRHVPASFTSKSQSRGNFRLVQPKDGGNPNSM